MSALCTLWEVILKKVTVGNERRLERRRVTKKRGGAGAEEQGVGGRGREREGIILQASTGPEGNLSRMSRQNTKLMII